MSMSMMRDARCWMRKHVIWIYENAAMGECAMGECAIRKYAIGRNMHEFGAVFHAWLVHVMTHGHLRVLPLTFSAEDSKDGRSR